MPAKRKAVVRTSSIPAPIGGLNARDSLADMAATDALTLDNFFPNTTDVSLRPGYRAWATGMGSAPVETLLPYRSGLLNKLFAVAGGSVYDATVQGPVPAAAVSGLTNSRFQYVNFGTPGGQFLCAVNGTNPMQRFDGSTWADATTAPAVTGFDTSKAASINSFGNRLWLVERGSLRAWYLPLQSIGGAATSLDLSSLFRLGGSLAGMITWTVAGTQTTSQYAVFVSTEGEVIIYEGYDPSNAATWGLVGQARIGRPIGGRFWTRVGTDVVLLSADGFVPLSKVLQLDRENVGQAVSNKIDSLARLSIAQYGNNFGWQAALYPASNKLIVNVPVVENAQSYQFVMNTITGAWCRYVNLNASVWETVQDSLYFGGVGAVYQAEYGNDDNGDSIYGVVRPAYNYFGDRVAQKFFRQVRPTLVGGAQANVLLDLTTDFDTTDPIATAPLSTATSLPTWNVSPWNLTAWQPSRSPMSRWYALGGMGFAASARVQVNCRGFSLSFENMAYTFEVGGLYGGR